MQRILSIILVLSFFSYQSYHSLIYLNYAINKSYFINVLCENKNNPEKQGCNGKCHLKKQLDQQKPVEKDHPFSKTATLSFYPDLIAVFLKMDQIKHLYSCKKTNRIPHSRIATRDYIKAVFHPPEGCFDISLCLTNY